MPTNLPPDYFELEKRFRAAETVGEKIEALKAMLSVVPKHKGTDHLRADLRRRLAKLNDEAQAHKGSAKRDSAFHIPKAGAGQVILIGPSLVGKSSLWVVLTGYSETGEVQPRQTWEPVPGMMPVENLLVQLVDTPPLSRDFTEPRLKELLRHADLLLLVVDLHQDPISQVQETCDVLEEYAIIPEDRKSRYSQGERWLFIPLLVLVNKCDTSEDEELYQIFCELVDDKRPCLPVSAVTGRNLKKLEREILEQIQVIRVYTKAPGKEPDNEHPFVLKKGSTLEDLAGRIHKDFLNHMKFARAWGSAVHDGQMVQRDYVLQDGDIVEIHTST